MRRPKVICFRYKRYDDIYVSNVLFSNDTLRSMLDILPDQRILVLIEADENTVQMLSSISKSMGIAEAVTDSPVPRFSAVCNKVELCSAFAQVHVNDLEGAFIAHINDMAETKDLLESVVYIASTMVKQGQSDISFSINFPENQMVLSFAKGNYEVTSMKDKIYRMFEG